LEGSRKEKKEEEKLDYRDILKRRDPSKAGRKQKEDIGKEERKRKEERKYEEKLAQEEKIRERLLLPSKKLQDRIKNFEKFDQSGKIFFLIFERPSDY
jgi:hypothetical protein